MGLIWPLRNLAQKGKGTSAGAAIQRKIIHNLINGQTLLVSTCTSTDELLQTSVRAAWMFSKWGWKFYECPKRSSHPQHVSFIHLHLCFGCSWLLQIALFIQIYPHCSAYFIGFKFLLKPHHLTIFVCVWMNTKRFHPY